MEGRVLIESLQLQNFLSYSPQSQEISLLPLNVLIGPNGSGKSNLIEAIELLRAMPSDVATPIRKGGIQNWTWKGSNDSQLEYMVNIDAIVRIFHHYKISHSIELILLASINKAFVQDHIQQQINDSNWIDIFNHNGTEITVYERNNSSQQLDRSNESELVPIVLDANNFNLEQSVLSQFKDSTRMSGITFLGQRYSSIRIYRNWDLGRNTPSRQPQPADLANDFLEEDASNLALVINDLQNKPGVKSQIIKRLQQFNPLFDDITTKVYGNTVQLFLHEKGLKETIPATRLPDGTLQFLCLLAILCHPEPPPLVCIEEPELGLHPDVMPILAELFLEASQRMQLIVSTHSDALVSALSSTPEAILVCERDENGTQLKRLEAEPLAAWLEKYSLGDLWRMGEIGGVRW